MQAPDSLSHFNLLFVDNDIQMVRSAYSLFSPMFKSVTLAHSAQQALALMKKEHIDVLITDIEMPEEDGLSLVEKVRHLDAEMPIVVLSAYDEQHYLFRAVNLRIDAYIIKPLSSKKLSPVLENIAARLQHKMKKIRLAEKVCYDFSNRSLIVDGLVTSLGKKERLLLELLLVKPGRIVPPSEIQKAVWMDQDMTESAFKNLLREVRRKLPDNIIKNVPTHGWFLAVECASE